MHFQKITCTRLFVLLFALMMFAAVVGVGSACAASCTNATFKGVYGVFYSGYDGTSPAVTVGQYTSNGTGGLSGSFTHSIAGKIGSFTFSGGTYSLAKNCQGTMSYTVDGVAVDFTFALDESNKTFQIIRTDSGIINVGFIQPLGTATCGLSGKSVTYAFNAYGGTSSSAVSGYVGQVTLDGKGNITGTETVNADGVPTTGVAVTGTYTQTSGCTGTLQITPKGFSTQNFASFAVNSNKELLLVETDSGTTVGGNIQ